METPPLWHATIYTDFPSLALLGQCKARPSNFVPVYLFIYLFFIFGFSAPPENGFASSTHRCLHRSITKMHWPPMNKFACKLHGHIVHLILCSGIFSINPFSGSAPHPGSSSLSTTRKVISFEVYLLWSSLFIMVVILSLKLKFSGWRNT